MRNLISKIVEATPGLVVADKAMNGAFALQKIPRCDPDVIVLDLEMPEMNGIEFLKERKRLGIDVPVVILSSLAKKGAQITMEALSLGAADFVTKPSGSTSSDIHTVAGELARLLLAHGAQHRKLRGKTAHVYDFDAPERFFEPAPLLEGRAREKLRVEPPRPARQPGPIEVIAIGISTGGPNAIAGGVFPDRCRSASADLGGSAYAAGLYGRVCQKPRSHLSPGRQRGGRRRSRAFRKNFDRPGRQAFARGKETSRSRGEALRFAAGQRASSQRGCPVRKCGEKLRQQSNGCHNDRNG